MQNIIRYLIWSSVSLLGWYHLLTAFVRARIGWWHYSPVAPLFLQKSVSVELKGEESHLVSQTLTTVECRVQYQQYADNIQLSNPELHKRKYTQLLIPELYRRSYWDIDPMSGGHSVLDGLNRVQLNPSKTEWL